MFWLVFIPTVVVLLVFIAAEDRRDRLESFRRNYRRALQKTSLTMTPDDSATLRSAERILHPVRWWLTKSLY